MKKSRKPKLKSGLFITFEGGEGAGKSTQIKLLAAYLEKQGYPMTITREPGGTGFAQKIRQFLLKAPSWMVSKEMELVLYEIARWDHVRKIIGPALKKGHIVLCDRFTDSTLAYQGYGRGFSHVQIHFLNKVASRGIIPDITFLIDIPVSVGLKRAHKRQGSLDRLEKEAKEFHERIRAGFLTLAKKEPKRFVTLHGNQSSTTIAAAIRKYVARKLAAVV